MRIWDIVELQLLEGPKWQGMNERLGVLEWMDSETGRVALTAHEEITVPKENIVNCEVNVEIGQAVCAVGLGSPEWRPLNHVPGYVVSELDLVGRVLCRFPDPWGDIPLLLSNITNVSKYSAHTAATLKTLPTEPVDVREGLSFMFKEGTLVEVFDLRSPDWTPLNGVRGIICGPIESEEDGARVPISFPEPWGTRPILPRNLKTAKGSRYVTLTIDTDNLTQGMSYEGTRVVSVVPGSTSWEAGIKPEDRIRAIASQPTYTSQDIATLIQSMGRGTQCIVTVESPPTQVQRPQILSTTTTPDYSPPVPIISASERCQACGGIVELGRRCPASGYIHGREPYRYKTSPTSRSRSPVHNIRSVVQSDVPQLSPRRDNSSSVEVIPPPSHLPSPPAVRWQTDEDSDSLVKEIARALDVVERRNGRDSYPLPANNRVGSYYPTTRASEYPSYSPMRSF